MTNINVRVVGTANMTQMGSAYSKLQAQVTALNAQLAQMVALQNGVDPSGYERMTKVAAQNSKTFRNAAASTGMFEVQQLKLNRATDEYIKKLQKQQMSFRDMARARKTAAAAYKEQLAMESSMTVRKNSGGILHGKDLLDVTYAREVSSQLDTAGQRLHFFNEQLKSGAHQMVNWGKNTQWAGRQMMVGFTMPMMAFGAAAGVMAYKVDKEITRITKVYDTAAKGGIAREKELMAVREASTATAIKAAQEYGSAGLETLKVQAELAATGVKGAELQKVTSEVMRISRLGELEYQDAINTTISLQSVFKMSNEELTESFNYMNSVENATSLATKDFAQAIPIAAAPVKQFGGDIQELGVLLTAMKERGIEATQGANAIKAAMQRLGRPSKQIQEEWTALTGTDITKIFEDAGSLTELFQQIGTATEDLGDKDKIKAFAGLFGTYQVTRMSALVDGMADLENGVGQVSRAYKLAEQDSSSWAKTADRETKELMASISGQWDAAFNEMMIQLSTLGKPFVQFATFLVKGVSKLISAFNDLPNIIKLIIAGGLGLAAIAGPVVMLTGLFANLMGSGMKVFGALLGRVAKLMGATELLTVEQRAANAAADMASTSLNKQISATDMLTLHTNELTASLAAANKEQRQQTFNALVGSGMSPSEAAAKMDKDNAALGPVVVGSTLADDTTKVAENSEKTKRNWKAAAGHMGIAAVAGSAMLMTSDGLVGNIAEVVFYASLLSPMLVPLGGLLGKGFKKAAPLAASLKTSMGGAMTNAKGFGKSVVSTGRPVRTLLGGVKSVGLSFARMLGPVGLLVTAVGLVGVGLHKWHEWNEKIAEQERAQERAIVSRTNLLSKSLDIQIRKQKELNTLSGTNVTGGTEVSARQLSEQLAASEEGKALVSAYTDADEIEKATIAAQKYSQVLTAVNGNSVKARKYVEALFLAAGDGALEAQTKASNLFMELGAEIDSFEQQNIWQNLIEANATSTNIDEAKIQGEALGKSLADAAAGAAQGAERAEVFGRFFASIEDSYNDMFDSLDSRNKEFFANVGVTTAAEMDSLISNYEAMQQGLMTQQDFGAMYGTDYGTQEFFDLMAAASSAQGMFATQRDNIKRTESAIVGELARQLGITQQITTMAELQATKEYQLQVATKATAQAAWDTAQAGYAARDAFVGLAPGLEKTSYETKLMELNTWRMALGMKETGLLSDGLNKRTVDLAGNVVYAGSKIDSNNGKLRTGVGLANQLANAFNSLSGADFASAYKTGMAQLQQTIADREMEMFDRNMNSALESRQAMWDGRADALSAEMDARGRALDAKWENKMDGAEKYWDARVEGVEKAIEAEEKAEEKRQKMFDAEIARITKLNEMANQNIDFNVALSEGAFDEAAKIRNDATAGDAQTALERAAGAGSRRSAKRVGKLENKRDSIEEAREKAMKALEKQEEAERAHLEKISAMRQDALAADTEADMEAQREIWEGRKELKEKELELFTALVAANKKQLEKMMDDAGISYNKFEKDTILPKGKKWGEYFGEQLKSNVLDAGRKLANDKMWEALGKGSVSGMLKGMGFSNITEFQHFIRTGKMGGGGGALGTKNSTGSRNNTGGTANNPNDNMGGITRHEGGFINEGKGSRKGVARNVKGLHSSETMVRAQKGEFMVNRDAAAKNASILETINSGKKFGTDTRNPVGGGYPGVAGMVAGAMNMGLAQGVKQAMTNAYYKRLAKNRRQREARATSGAWGNYSLPGVKPWVLEAANYLGGKYNISTILGVGQRSNYSEHPLGRALDFMVSDSRGTSLSAEVVKRNADLDAMYVIWRQHINSFDGQGWRPMEDRGSPTANHMDHVHVSFDPTGDTGDLPKPRGVSGKHYAQGPGGWSRPATPGKGWSNTHDYRAGIGTPLYAVSDGTVIESRAITSGGSPGNGLYSTPYRSYGETVVLRTSSGDAFRYAHLSPGTRIAAGSTVAGGTRIGSSGNTGNSSGPHVHFDVNGNYDAQGWLAGKGIALSKGTQEVRWDNTLANLHHGEAVLTKDINNKFKQGVDNFASGGNNEYNVHVHVNGTNASVDEITQKVVTTLKRIEQRKPRGRRNG